MVGTGLPHYVNRKNIYPDVLKLYANQSITKEYPFYVEFQGEKAIDIGGVSRDMFSAFFDELYIQMFDGATLLYPNISCDMSTFEVIGSIISHAYLVSGVLPDRIAFPCLAFILNKSAIPDSVLIEAYSLSLSIYENEVILKALGSNIFSDELCSKLIDILSIHGCKEIPCPLNIRRLLANAARYLFLIKPAAALHMLKQGIPVEHLDFWNSLSIDDLLSLYNAVSVSTEKVLNLLQEPEFENHSEKEVFIFLRKSIGSMSTKELRLFLRFVTGSVVICIKKITVTFNKLHGLAWRPTSHTCSSTIELPSTYATLPEFEAELKPILNDLEYTWTMDCV